MKNQGIAKSLKPLGLKAFFMVAGARFELTTFGL